MPAADATWTVEMLDALPDDGQRYEIIDGELWVTGYTCLKACPNTGS